MKSLTFAIACVLTVFPAAMLSGCSTAGPAPVVTTDCPDPWNCGNRTVTETVGGMTLLFYLERDADHVTSGAIVSAPQGSQIAATVSVAKIADPASFNGSLTVTSTITGDALVVSPAGPASVSKSFVPSSTPQNLSQALTVLPGAPPGLTRIRYDVLVGKDNTTVSLPLEVTSAAARRTPGPGGTATLATVVLVAAALASFGIVVQRRR